MKAEFSEFSYGYALSFEITTAFKPTATGAPLLPSLQDEAKPGYGYDIHFARTGWPLFLQFKLSHYLHTRRANYWTVYNTPYYRFPVYSRKKSKQHDLLKDLAKLHPEVYYVAPAFQKEKDFHDYFSTDSIFQNSMFVPLHLLKYLTDDDEHYITYSHTKPHQFRWHSENQDIFDYRIMGTAWLEHTNGLFDQISVPINNSFFAILHDELLAIINERIPQTTFYRPEPMANIDVPLVTIIRNIRYMLSSYFGAEMFIMQRPY